MTRAHKGWALDSVTVYNEITKMMKDDIDTPPLEGVYVHGLYLDVQSCGLSTRNRLYMKKVASAWQGTWLRCLVLDR